MRGKKTNLVVISSINPQFVTFFRAIRQLMGNHSHPHYLHLSHLLIFNMGDTPTVGIDWALTFQAQINWRRFERLRGKKVFQVFKFDVEVMLVFVYFGCLHYYYKDGSVLEEHCRENQYVERLRISHSFFTNRINRKMFHLWVRSPSSEKTLHNVSWCLCCQWQGKSFTF